MLVRAGIRLHLKYPSRCADCQRSQATPFRAWSSSLPPTGITNDLRLGSLAGLTGMVRRAVAGLPHGKTLPEDVWRTRHRFMLGVIWVQLAGLTVAGIVLGRAAAA